MIQISLFSGIGGFELAGEWAGYKNYVSCEINPFGQKVLNHYWPAAYHHDDVKTLTYELLNEQLIQRFGAGWRDDDIIVTGGFPCQPYSQAGKRLGKEDDRHLWPEMLRIIREVKPTWVVGENVSGLISWSDGLVFDEVQTDLEALSYEVQPFILPACAVNAPHRRDRVWFVAHSSTGIEGETIRGGNGKTALNGNSGYGDKGITPNTMCNGHKLRGLGENRSAQSQSISQQEQRERIWTDDRGISEPENATYSNKLNGNLSGFRASEVSQQQETGILSNISTYTTSQGREEREQKRQGENNCGSKRHGCMESTSNSCNEGLQRSEINGSIGRIGQKSHEQFAGFIRPDWSEFPTQSPVRSRNDGIPTGLVGITVPKHRNESIKAYGNAIVPQVVFQIFKAINEYTPKTLNKIQY